MHFCQHSDAAPVQGTVADLVQASASAHLVTARKCRPTMSERFNLFVKDRESTQKSMSASGGGGSDLVSIVEFQVGVHRKAAPARDLLVKMHGSDP